TPPSSQAMRSGGTTTSPARRSMSLARRRRRGRRACCATWLGVVVTPFGGIPFTGCMHRAYDRPTPSLDPQGPADAINSCLITCAGPGLVCALAQVLTRWLPPEPPLGDLHERPRPLDGHGAVRQLQPPAQLVHPPPSLGHLAHRAQRRVDGRRLPKERLQPSGDREHALGPHR